MKNLLLPAPENHPIDRVVDCAVAFGKMFGSCIEGIALAPDLSRMIAAEFPIDPHYIDPENRREIVAEARAAFERAMAERHVEPCERAGGAVGWLWSTRDLGEDARVASYGRLFDLTVLPRPDQGRDGARIATVETILFESGRPVLLAPPVEVKTVGRNVAIAWNGSPETARTIAFSMPVLAKAEKVTVVVIEGWEVGGPEGSEQVERLKRHGIDARLSVRPGADTPGESILNHARSLGCDLIVKGAYTQSRLRQMIFGGATSYLLSHTDIPMFIAH